jgi:hypothetical protein
MNLQNGVEEQNLREIELASFIPLLFVALQLKLK